MADDYEPISEFFEHEGDKEWYDSGEELYEQMLDIMLEDFGRDVIDQHAVDLMWGGWFDPESDIVSRMLDRFEFFDYTGLEYEDFDWDAWREWYES